MDTVRRLGPGSTYDLDIAPGYLLNGYTWDFGHCVRVSGVSWLVVTA